MRVVMRATFALLLFAAALLAGCDTSGGGGGAPAPTFTPRPTDTAIAAPTTAVVPEPTNTAVTIPVEDTPTAGDNQPPEATPTAGSSADLVPYSSPDGNWSISYPTGWNMKKIPISGSQGINTQFMPADQKAIIQVTYIPGSKHLSQQELADLASNDLKSAFSSLGYNETGRVPQKDGSMRIDFTLSSGGQNFSGEAFVEQRGNDYYMLMIAYDETLKDTFPATAQQVLNSYKLPGGGTVPSAETPTEGTSTELPTDTPNVLSTPSGGGGGTSGTGTLLPMGQTGEIGGAKVTVNSTREGQSTLPPKAGNRYLIVNVTVENNTKDAMTVSSLLSFKVVDSTGKEMDRAYAVGDQMIESTNGGQVAPGQKITGEAAWEVPTNATGLVFVYTPFDLTGGASGDLRFKLDK